MIELFEIDNVMTASRFARGMAFSLVFISLAWRGLLGEPPYLIGGARRRAMFIVRYWAVAAMMLTIAIESMWWTGLHALRASDFLQAADNMRLASPYVAIPAAVASTIAGTVFVGARIALYMSVAYVVPVATLTWAAVWAAGLLIARQGSQ